MHFTKNNFKFFCTASKSFIQKYKYNGYVEELFDDNLLVPCQCTGVADIDGNYIYENDVIEFERTLAKNVIKKYTAFVTFQHGAFLVLSKEESSEGTLGHMWLHDLVNHIFNLKLKIIGTRLEAPTVYN